MKSILTLAIFLFAAVSVHAITIDTVVVPNALASAEGNIDNSFPFITTDRQRYQQVFGAGDFPSSVILISQIAFRPDAISEQPFNTTLTNVQINLSTTRRAVDGLSTTFAANVGADDTAVHTGSLALSSAFTGPANGPKDFDIVINLSTPFLYNPNRGNLLLDVRNFDGGSSNEFFDADNTIGDAVSRSISGNVNSPIADYLQDSYGLVTRFTYTAVPEPGGSLLMLVALQLVALSRRERLN
jgi:hypothetical protein